MTLLVFVFAFLVCVLSIVTEVATQDLQGTYVQEGQSEYVYQASGASFGVKGVLFLAHGCQHSSTDWWPKSASCPLCIGLPVEMTIVKKALARGLVVVAVSSQNRQHKCWDSSDLPIAVSAIASVREKLKLDASLPLFLLGASSGGSFVGNLGQKSKQLGLPIAAVCIQISGLHHTRHAGTTAIMDPFPAFLFVHMTKDEGLARHIQTNLAAREQIPLPVMKELKCDPLPVTGTFFFDHGNALNKDDSAALVAAFKQAGILDASTNLLVNDPRDETNSKYNWRTLATKVLPHVVPSRDTLRADHSPISELLNLAFGLHEITDAHLDEVMEFFFSQAEAFAKNAG